MELKRPDASLFERMTEQVRDYAIFLLDPAGRIISWNSGARRIKQYAAEEIIGQHFSLFYTPQDKARNWPASELERATLDGRFEDEGWRVRKDGSRFWANVVITALRDDAGKLVAFSKITRDLSARRREEEALRQSEERFRLLVEGVQDYAIYLLSPEGLITSWNTGAHRIKGYDAAEILGAHFSRFYTQEDIDAGKPWAELAMARQHGRAEDEGWRVRKDGSHFWARVVVTSLYDGEGRLSGFAKVTQDMTQQRHSASLESATQRVNDFLAVLAHELRNPLAPIRNAASLLEHTQPGDADFETLRRAIDRQSAQLSRIVDDLLDISRVTRGTLEIRLERVDVADVAARALEAARPAIEAGGHRLRVDLPPAPLLVDGDTLRLTQALTNVLNNAARYTDRGGLIEISARAERSGADTGEALITVRDSGRGIEPELIDSIFGMFVQGREALERVGAGLGVGLALARSIVELHHGKIEAKSEGVGKGAEFVLRLPLAHGDVAAKEPPALRAAPTSARRVLVIDDSVDAAAMLAAFLSHLGHEVQVANDGVEALRVAASYRPDVVLLDIGMPGMNGFEVARRLRAQARPQPLIVAVTGWGKPDDQKRSREAGFDLHLVKPVEEAELRQVLAARTVH